MGQDQLDKFIQEQLRDHQSQIDTDALWTAISTKEQEQVDAEIKDKLYDHETPIDSDKLWRAIRVRRSGWKRYALLASIILLGGLLSIFLTADKEREGNEANSSVSTETSLSKSSDDFKVFKSSLDELDTSSNEDTSTSSAYKTTTSSISNVALQNKESSYSKTTNTKTSVSANNKPTIANQNTSDNSTETTGTKSTITQLSAISSKNEDLLSETTSASLLDQVMLIDKRSRHIGQTVNMDNFLDRIPDIDHCFRNSKSIECYRYGPRTFHTSILGYGTVDYYLKNMQGNEDISSYVSDRKSSQSYQISNRAGVQIKFAHKRGIYFKTGIEFGVVRERFSYEIRDTFTEILPDQLISIDVDANGDSTYVYGNAPVTTISQKTWRTNNKYETIGIPLIVGYQTTDSKKNFNFGFEIGTIYDFSHKFTGHLLDSSSYPTDANAFFNTSNKFNLTGGANVTYKLNEKINSYLMISFRQNLKSINDNSVNIINQKNTVFGIGLGFEFNL